MAITRAQQAKQMLQDGGMLVQPGFGGIRQGYRGDDAARSSEGTSKGRADPGKDAPRGERSITRNPMAQFGTTPEEKAIVAAAGEREMAKRDVPIGLGDKLGIPSFLPTLKTGLNFFQVPTGNQFAQGFRRSLIDLNRVDPEPDRDGGGIPYWAQLGFSSEAEYLAALARTQAPSDMDQEPEEEVDMDEGLRLAFRANGGRIGFRGGGKDLGTASSRDFGFGNRDARDEGAIRERMQNIGGGGGGGSSGGQGPVAIKAPVNIVEPKSNLQKIMDIFRSEDDDEDTGVSQTTIDKILNPDAAKNFEKLTTQTGSLLSQDPDLMATLGLNKADGGRIGLMEGGMPYEGGIMDLESARQMYGLGKLVKKVTRTVKKIAKSPVGKAALLYAGTAGLGSLAAGGGMGSLFKLGTYAPSSFAANVPRIFSRAGLKNILVGGKGASLGGNRGMGAGIIPEFSGIFGSGGAFSPLKAIGITSAVAGLLTPEQEEEAQELARGEGIDIDAARNAILAARREQYAMDSRARRFRAEGGSMKEPVAKKTMPLLDMGGKEMDLRQEGGFVPIGRMEKADDVPARLSKNEFVFTADAVRNAGDGDVDKGAEVMYNMMKNLESGGDVSEESQGLEGARKMFQTSQRLEEVL